MRNKPAALFHLALMLSVFFCINSVETYAFQQASAIPASQNSTVDSKAMPDKAPGDKPEEKAASSPSVEERLKALEQIIERQQREIQALREIVEKGKAETVAANSDGQAVGAQPIADQSQIAANTPQPVKAGGNESAQTSSTDKKVEELYKKFGSIRLSGDVRFRLETFHNQGFDSLVNVASRNRLRFRARLALDGALNKNLEWGIRLASGQFTDPISSNQTLTDFYERKPFALDRAFIKYDSKSDRVGVQLIAGKFSPTFNHTQMVWDNDIHVEGASEAIYFKTDSSLQQVKIVAFQLPFKESSGGKDGVLYGGQVQTDWKMSPTISANVNVAYYDWGRVDSVLQVLDAPTTLVNGGLSHTTTNRLIRDANGKPVAFLAGFKLLDVLSELTWHANSRFPVRFTFDFVRNMSGRINDEQNGYWTGVQVGRAREQGDWRFGYTYTRIEQDAVLSLFSFSDILPSNSRAHITSISYQIANGVNLEWTGLFSQRVNKIVVASPFNRYLSRMQFDVSYRF